MHTHTLRGAGRMALLVALVAFPTSWATAQDDPAPTLLSPDAAVAASLAVHSGIRQAEAELALARGIRSQSALFLNNPAVAGASSVDGARASASLMQPLSLTGEGWYARSASRARVDAGEAGLHRSRLIAAAETRRAYAHASGAVGKVRVALEGVELAARLRHAATRQNEEGEASTLDFRLASLAEVQSVAGLLAARELEAEALAALAELTALPVSPSSLLPDPSAAVPEPSKEGTSERSDVVAAKAHLRSAEAELRRQRAATMPPVRVGAFVDLEGGQTFLGPSVGVELPLFNRNQVGRRQATGRLGVAAARVAAVSALAATESATSELRVAEATRLSTTVVSDPIGEARAALASIEAGYVAGEIDLSSTVLLQGVALNGETAAIQLLESIAAARLDLLLANEDDALLGGPR